VRYSFHILTDESRRINGLSRVMMYDILYLADGSAMSSATPSKERHRPVWPGASNAEHSIRSTSNFDRANYYTWKFASFGRASMDASCQMSLISYEMFVVAFRVDLIGGLGRIYDT
jgi:hypothetical protein